MERIWSTVMSLAMCAVIYWIFRSLLAWFRQYRVLVNAMRDVGCEKPYWLLGHVGKLTADEKGLVKFAKQWTKDFPKCTQVWFGPVKFYFACYHPDLMKIILSSDEPKDEIGYKFLRPWIGNGLVTNHGRKWKRNRRLLTPAFHIDILKGYLESTNDAATELLDGWSSDGCKKYVSVELFHDVSLMALDNLLRCILSHKSNCQHGGNREYLNAVRIVTDVANQRIFDPVYHLDFLFYLTPFGRRYKKALKIVHDYTENIIWERKVSKKPATSSPGSKIDFLDILLEAKDDKGVGLSHPEICDEVDTIVFAGHDTVSSAISFAFYNLANHPEFQEKCRSEVNDVLGLNKRVKWEDLSKMKYLTMFIKESLRLYPPVVDIARHLSQPVSFPRGFGSDQYDTRENVCTSQDASRTLPKGINIAACIYVLHRNPAVWSDPDTFNPLRFTPENVAKRSPHAYVPFSSGPRNCIGQNFAMNEMKVVLALALSRYRISLDNAYPPLKLHPKIILRAKNGIHIKVEQLVSSRI